MGIAQDLLQLANHLATYELNNPTQASLRRAVSTAYYALFHLLLEDASQRWLGSPEARYGLERAFDHGQMKRASNQFRGTTWHDWFGTSQQVPAEVRRVASTFVDLQEERHTADYDNPEQWSLIEVQAILNTAQAAFQDWESIHMDQMAGNYLLAMLLRQR